MPRAENQLSDILNTLPAKVSDVLNPWTERSPDRPALVETAGTWTYRQLALVVAETETCLLNSGVRPGDRVMIVCENCRAFVATLLALAAIDAWPVLVNARLSAREVDQIRDHCGARRVIYTTSVSPHATEHARRHGAGTQELGSLGRVAVGSLNEEVGPEPIDPKPENRVAAMIYTSGTTGLPKGVMLSHRNLLFIAGVSARIRALIPQDRLYGVLPMSHAVGLSVVLLGTLLSGATLYLSPRFDPMAARTALETDQITVMLGVPAMFAQFLEYARIRGLNSLHFPALRIISSSGAPLHPETKAAVERLFGLALHNGYGLTECSPTIAQASIEAPRSDTSVGRVLPGVEIQLVGNDGKPVARGDVGELWVRGPNIMKGYYRAPEETASAINSEGWFNTRDLARVDGDNLFIVGRTKDLIIRMGFNVYPVEIEAVLNAHPEVVRSAVLGRSAGGDEEIVAFVQLTPDAQLKESQLAEYAARILAAYKRPSKFFLVPEVPVNLAGKVLKDELWKMVTRAHERAESV